MLNHRLSPVHFCAAIVVALLAGVSHAEDTAEVTFSAATIVVDGDRNLSLRVVAGSGDAAVPVIILSHGTFSAGAKYDPVSSYWAENGYIVILPDHRDANYAETPTSEAQMLDIIDSRARDLVAIVDQLDEIESQVPAIKGRLDAERIVSAGHSVGTQTALLMTGLKFRNPETGKVRAVDESRYRATILLSDPGKMALMPAEVWLGGSKPVLMATGPEDYGVMGDGKRSADYQNEILEPDSPLVGKHYLLSIDGLDHQFGGLIHKQTGTNPDVDAMNVFLDVSTAFLDLYARDNAAAAAELEPRQINERATLTVE